MSAVYSFLDVDATLTAAGASIDLGYGSAVAGTGIEVSLNNDRNAMTIGADGEGMHSLRADKSGTVTVRLLAISDRNELLQKLFNAQSLSSSTWGANVITIRNRGNNEITVCRGCAFKRQPTRSYATEGQEAVEWTFDCIKVDTETGSYTQI